MPAHYEKFPDVETWDHRGYLIGYEWRGYRTKPVYLAEIYIHAEADGGYTCSPNWLPGWKKAARWYINARSVEDARAQIDDILANPAKFMLSKAS